MHLCSAHRVFTVIDSALCMLSCAVLPNIREALKYLCVALSPADKRAARKRSWQRQLHSCLYIELWIHRVCVAHQLHNQFELTFNVEFEMNSYVLKFVIHILFSIDYFVLERLLCKYNIYTINKKISIYK